MLKIMLFNIVISTLFLTVLSEYVITSTEEEMDNIIEMLMNNAPRQFNTDSVEKAIEEEKRAKGPYFEKGLWMCGECDKIDDSKLVYSETYNVETNYEDEYMDLQVGLSLPKMSCVTVSTDGGLTSVTRVSGDCAGEGVTLRLTGAAECEVRVYE